MKETVGAALAIVRMLELHGSLYAFGAGGKRRRFLDEALASDQATIANIVVRSDRTALLMANAYAAASGYVGIAHGLDGASAGFRSALDESRTGALPVIAFLSSAKDGADAIVSDAAISRPGELPSKVREAFARATTGRPGPIVVDIAEGAHGEVDLADITADQRFGELPGERVVPRDETIRQAAAIIGAARRAVIVCGGGVLSSGAEPEVIALAERVGAAVATTLDGRGSIRDSHALSVGVLDDAYAEHRAHILAGVDVVVVVGSHVDALRMDSAAKVISIDLVTPKPGSRVDVAIVGDAKLSLLAVHDALSEHLRDTHAATAREAHALIAELRDRKFASFRERADSDDRPIRCERVVYALQKVLPHDAIVVSDRGPMCDLLAGYLEQDVVGRGFIAQRQGGEGGYALATACGAQFAAPDRCIIAVTDDDGFAASCGELETVVAHDLPIVILVVSTSEAEGAVDVARTNRAKVAEAFGLTAWRVEDPDELGTVFARAIREDGPTLVEVLAKPL